MKYRERYDLNREYYVLTPDIYEKIFNGAINSVEWLVTVCKVIRFNSAKTILTTVDGTILQCSTLSKSKELPKMALFGDLNVEQQCLHYNDFYVYRSKEELRWLLNNVKNPNYRSDFMRQVHRNDGRIISGFETHIGGNCGDNKVIAGYLIDQNEINTSITEVSLPRSTFYDFMTELAQDDVDSYSIVNSYLVEG